MNRARVRVLLGILAALGAAWWFENLATLEWAYPYCGILDNGEAAGVVGFPLPYRESVIAASATTSFIPWLYAINLAVIAAGVFVVLHPVARRLGAWKPLVSERTIGAVAALLLATAVAIEAFAISIGISLPVSSFSGVDQYSTLRPVQVVFGPPRNCTASPFWYPPPDRAR